MNTWSPSMSCKCFASLWSLISESFCDGGGREVYLCRKMICNWHAKGRGSVYAGERDDDGRWPNADEVVFFLFFWWFAVIVRVGWGKVRTERNKLPYLTCSHHNLCRESNSNMDIFEEPEKPSVSFILLFCIEFVFHLITLFFCSYLAYLYHPFLIRYIRELYSGHADRRVHDLHKTITYSRRPIQKVSFEECCHFYGIIFLSLGSSFQFPLSTFHAVV